MDIHQTSAGYSSGILRQARVWVTLLWTLTLSLGVAGWDWSERRLAARAEDQTIIMLPAGDLDDEHRQEVRKQLNSEPGVSLARWESPAELVRQIAQRFPQSSWNELFPAEENWLPWMMEIHPWNPLEHMDTIRSFIAKHEAEGEWRLILWDQRTLNELAAQRKVVRTGFAVYLGLLAIAGALALLTLPWPAEGGWKLVTLNAVLGVATPAAVWVLLLAAEANLDVRSLWVTLGMGFTLATFVASVLRSHQRKQLEMTIREDADERNTRTSQDQ